MPRAVRSLPFERHSRQRHAIALKTLNFMRIIGEQSDFADTEVPQDLRADTIIAQVLLESQLKIRLDRI